MALCCYVAVLAEGVATWIVIASDLLLGQVDVAKGHVGIMSELLRDFIPRRSLLSSSTSPCVEQSGHRSYTQATGKPCPANPVEASAVPLCFALVDERLSCVNFLLDDVVEVGYRHAVHRIKVAVWVDSSPKGGKPHEGGGNKCPPHDCDLSFSYPGESTQI
eukprot:9493346-Pyramimonas_sp.AAC.2